MIVILLLGNQGLHQKDEIFDDLILHILVIHRLIETVHVVVCEVHELLWHVKAEHHDQISLRFTLT